MGGYTLHIGAGHDGCKLPYRTILVEASEGTCSRTQFAGENRDPVLDLSRTGCNC